MSTALPARAAVRFRAGTSWRPSRAGTCGTATNATTTSPPIGGMPASSTRPRRGGVPRPRSPAPARTGRPHTRALPRTSLRRSPPGTDQPPAGSARHGDRRRTHRPPARGTRLMGAALSALVALLRIGQAVKATWPAHACAPRGEEGLVDAVPDVPIGSAGGESRGSGRASMRSTTRPMGPSPWFGAG